MSRGAVDTALLERGASRGSQVMNFSHISDRTETENVLRK